MDVDPPLTAAQPLADSTPAGAALEIEMLRRAMLPVIVAETLCAPLSKPFSKSVEYIRQVPPEPAAVVAGLRAKFPESQLLDAGLLERSAENRSQLARVFGGAGAQFILRRDEAGQFVDAVSSRAVLSGARAEVQRIIEARANSSNASGLPMLLASNDFELCYFELLGLPYTSAAAVRRLTATRIHALFRNRPPYRQRKYYLTVPAWQMSRFSGEIVPETVNYLTQICGIDPIYNLGPNALFRIWVPSYPELGRFKSLRSFRDRIGLAAAFRNSLQSSCYSPAEGLKFCDGRADTTVAQARQRLDRLVADSRDFPLVTDVNAALTIFEFHFDKNIVRPFTTTSGPSAKWEAAGGQLVAALMQDWFSSLDLVCAAKQIRSGRQPGKGGFDERRFEQRLKIVHAFCKLHRVFGRTGRA